MVKQFKVIVTNGHKNNSEHLIFAINKEHAEMIVINHYRLLGLDYFIVEAEEVE